MKNRAYSFLLFLFSISFYGQINQPNLKVNPKKNNQIEFTKSVDNNNNNNNEVTNSVASKVRQPLIQDKKKIIRKDSVASSKVNRKFKLEN